MSTDPATPKCPKCGSPAVRRSHRTTIDRIACLFSLRAMRCRECRHRFRVRYEAPRVQRMTPGQRSESLRRRRAAKRRDMVLYACALVAFAVFAYVITRERG